jgi:hypothetical protein
MWWSWGGNALAGNPTLEWQAVLSGVRTGGNVAAEQGNLPPQKMGAIIVQAVLGACSGASCSRNAAPCISVEKLGMYTGEDHKGGFRRGQSVTVRSLGEILATLDAEAKLEGMPFMPEMARFCGRTFRVHRRAERACIEGIGTRGLRNTVLLEGLRCSGSSHASCQRGCLLFWKEAWLKPAVAGATDSTGEGPAESLPSTVVDACDALQLPTRKGNRFYCQSTELAAATEDLLPGKLRHYLHDLRIGEMSPRRFAYVLWRAMTDRLWRLLHGRSFYEINGEQKKTLTAQLNLQAGELVEIKSAGEIKSTLDLKGRNRGLSFDPEMLLHCGRRYRVAAPLRTIISEENGELVQLSNTVILEGLACQGICGINCPRANYLFWREIWLKRVDG